MEAVELAIPAAVEVPKLMGSEVLMGARVCTGTDAEARESNGVSALTGPKIDECNSLVCDRGIASAGEPSSWSKKADTELCKTNGRLSKLTTDDVSQGINHGITISGTSLMIGFEGKQIQRKVGKSPRNGSGSFKKPSILQTDNLLHHVDGDDAKMELDMVGSHLVKCSNTDKSQAIKQKSNINSRRGDRRNSRIQMKAKNDPFSGKSGVPNFSPASGGSNTFVMYGLKPEVHDITKLVEDLSIDQLLDGSYNCPTQGNDKGKRPASVNENIVDSVNKVCSILQLRGIELEKQAEDFDSYVNKKNSLISSPSNTNMDQVFCNKAGAPAKMNGSPLYQPQDIVERLALPPAKDLDSLLQDAVKPAGSVKLTDSRSSKPLSHRVSLPAFSWSHVFNGHCKSNNDATKSLSKSTCQGRWVRVRNSASFTGEGGTEGFLDLDSLTYDDNLVPVGQLKYRLPEIENSSYTLVNRQDKSSAVCSTSSLPPHESGSISDYRMNASYSPTAVAAAKTLCAMKAHPNGILKWPKQPSQKAMKARKSRLSEKPEEGLLTPKSEPTLDHVLRSNEYGTSSKKPRLSVVDRREEYIHHHTHTVIGLCSVSAPRSNRSSPNRLSRDSVAETRHINGSLTKPSFVVPSPSRVLDRDKHNPQKARKVGTMDWSRARKGNDN